MLLWSIVSINTRAAAVLARSSCLPTLLPAILSHVFTARKVRARAGENCRRNGRLGGTARA